MYAAISTAVTIGILLINLTGLALLATRLTGHYGLAKVVAPVALALATFFVEHFVGLGSIEWIWPPATALSVWSVAKERHRLRGAWRIELVFVAAFAWALAWRIAFPGLVASSEKIGDLAMIVSYMSGERLPPPDAWLPPYRFDIYYAFQHYAAALMGRILATGPGLTYQLGVSVTVALTVTAAALFARIVAGSPARAALVVLAFVGGGTGASLPVHAMQKAPELHSAMRFIGGTATPQRVETGVGHAVVAAAGVADRPVSELPSETFAYLVSLGDFHPPLSGFYLLAVALLCIALVESGATPGAAQVVLAATPVLCLVSDGWALPLQSALVLAWVGSRLARRLPVDWSLLVAGAGGALVLCQPFLAAFARSGGYDGVVPRIVPWALRTPPLLGAIVLYPIVVVALLPIVGRDRRRWLWAVGAFWLVLLAGTELIYMDDPYSGPFERFNTTLKWWPWIQAGALLTVGACGLRSAGRIVRIGTAVILLSVSTYAADQIRVLALSPKVELGRLDGAAWITRDNVERAILEYLAAQPRGIVLQRPEAGAFTPAPALILFARQTAFLGWAGHERLWRGSRVDIDRRAEDVATFYRGELPDSEAWLRQHAIDHVLWLKTEASQPAGAFERIDAQIRGGYHWHEYYRADEFRVGVWTRR